MNSKSTKCLFITKGVSHRAFISALFLGHTQSERVHSVSTSTEMRAERKFHQKIKSPLSL